MAAQIHCDVEKQQIFTVTVESDNLYMEFEQVERHQARSIQHEVVQFLSSINVKVYQISVSETIDETKENK